MRIRLREALIQLVVLLQNVLRNRSEAFIRARQEVRDRRPGELFRLDSEALRAFVKLLRLRWR